MTNAEKIIILKENIKNYIINSKNIDENYLFNFASNKQKKCKLK